MLQAVNVLNAASSELQAKAVPELLGMLTLISGKGKEEACEIVGDIILARFAELQGQPKKRSNSKDALRELLESGAVITPQEAAEKLGVSVSTIKTHLPDLQNPKYCGKGKEPLTLMRVGNKYRVVPAELLQELGG